jgi:hypothetical protein
VGVVGYEDKRWALDAGGGRHPWCFESKKLRFGWGAGVCFCLFQVFKNLPNHLVLGNESDHAVGTSTITLQRLGLIHSLDELRPAFSESGTLFWRELGLVFGWGGLVGAEGLKGESCLFPVGPGLRRIGPKIPRPVCPRLWNLSKDSRDESSAFGLPPKE